MNPEFWLANWNNNKIGFHQQETNSHLISFWQHLNVAPSCHVFVPLCGKSLDLIWLYQQGHKVLGVELSAIAASQFFSENGLSYTAFKQADFHCHQTGRLTLLQGDFFNLTADHLHNVQGVFDRASLIALPPELRQKYVRHLKSILPVGTNILLLTLEYEQTEMTGPPFSVNEAEIQVLYQDSYQIRLLFAQDVLDSYPQFRSIGLKSLQEKVYLLKAYKTAG